MKRNTLTYLQSHFIHLLIVLFVVSSCKRAADITAEAPKPERYIVQDDTNPGLTGKVIHLYSDTVYILTSDFTRLAGEQLIIDEGTLIKVGKTDAVEGFYSPGGSITIHPGGLLIANGTKNNPIVFTANAPKGAPNKNWNGITIKGNSFNNEVVTGTENAADLSCSVKYLRIEFASLTLDAVGNRSVVENVQVSYAQSGSSFTFFGGTFNARNLISYACGGPADFYITKGYNGKMQNILAYRHPLSGNTGGDKSTSGIVIENNQYGNDQMPYTFPIISNATVIGPHNQNGTANEYKDSTLQTAALITKNDARFKIRNSLFLGFPKGGWYLDDLKTANNFNRKVSELGQSSFFSSDTSRTFYLGPQLPYTAAQFKNFIISSGFAKQLTLGAEAFYQDPFNYENTNLSVKTASTILTGADFGGATFSDPFFNKVTYLGAIGADNWLQGWTNFVPLRTNYNNPQ